MLTRRSLLAAPAVLTAAAASIPAGFARAPMPNAEATPPVYRFKVGAFAVTAITDSTLDLAADLLPAAKEKSPRTRRNS